MTRIKPRWVDVQQLERISTRRHNPAPPSSISETNNAQSNTTAELKTPVIALHLAREESAATISQHHDLSLASPPLNNNMPTFFALLTCERESIYASPPSTAPPHQCAQFRQELLQLFNPRWVRHQCPPLSHRAGLSPRSRRQLQSSPASTRSWNGLSSVAFRLAGAGRQERHFCSPASRIRSVVCIGART